MKTENDDGNQTSQYTYIWTPGRMEFGGKNREKPTRSGNIGISAIIMSKDTFNFYWFSFLLTRMHHIRAAEWVSFYLKEFNATHKALACHSTANVTLSISTESIHAETLNCITGAGIKDQWPKLLDDGLIQLHSADENAVPWLRAVAV